MGRKTTTTRLNETKAGSPSGSEADEGAEENQDSDQDDDDDGANHGEDHVVRPKKVHKLSLTDTTDFNEQLKRRGVIYIARIPPRMTPTKVKSLLSEFGEVTRVYLVEEDPTVRKRRKKEHGKSGGKRYIEGWVEMASKRKAKHIAQSLNTTPISNHKRNPHYGTISQMHPLQMIFVVGRLSFLILLCFDR